MNAMMTEPVFNPAFESGLVRLNKKPGRGRIHLIAGNGSGLVCRPNHGYDTWQEAPARVSGPTCRTCIKKSRGPSDDGALHDRVV